jgi:hypothetical protein
MAADRLVQFWNDSFADAPMRFRFILQPAVAAYFAIRPGLADAAAGRGLFFWSLFGDRARRRQLLREAWTDIGKVFIAAVVIDVIGQLLVEHRIHPLRSVLVAVVLAVLPYIVFRGLLNRLGRRRK